MGIVFNGVLASRETGSLMPALAVDGLKISDCTINAIKIDNGDQKITKDELTGFEKKEPIVSNPKNLPLIKNGAWSLETELYANFNGDLEAGPLSLYGQEIDGMAIRRSSNRDNFSYWEDVKILNNIKRTVDDDHMYYFSDKNIESGVWYKYAIQPISQTTRGGLSKIAEKSVIFDDAFLVGKDGKQLNMRYDFSTSSIKRNIKESRIETIGSKYPFITRNSNVDYKEFSITGLITHFMDETEDFAPRAELFIFDEFNDSIVDMTPEYRALFREYGINNKNNTTLEREFRKKVHEFLTDGSPKLFKSPKVGNALVRLMDVNLASREDINGGMVYTFTCTAVEIGEASIENLDKYGIQKR